MKKLIVFLIALFFGFKSFSQSPKLVYVISELKRTNIDTTSQISNLDLKNVSPRMDSLSFVGSKRYLPSRTDDVEFQLGQEDEKVFLSFYNVNVTTGIPESKITLREAKIESISLIVNNEIIYVKTVREHEKNRDYYSIGLKSLKNIKSGTLIQVRFNKKNNDIVYYNGESAYFKYYDPLTTYQPFKSIPVLWIPTGMFATSLKRSEAGITFAPMPIGIAGGFKINKENGNYLGVSLCANWLIKLDNNENEKRLNFEAIAPGVILDINNYVTVGAVYGIDLTVENNNPGFSLMVGIAPDLLNLLKK